ncbi:MAG TPA: hypothetical protein VJ464_04365 [Blastocatellia bacterium]|nr:hypothetical protein [Blastocatellia bacterium]
MTTVIVPRVHFFDKQFLRVDEFRDEQLYQLAARRRHNVAHHSWGIVLGLEIAQEDGAVIVRPGMAIDGYGRELVLPDKEYLAEGAFDDLGADRLDVWLVYSRRDGEAAPEGYGGCGPAGARDAYRSDEVPRVIVERPVSNTVDARRPPGVQESVLSSKVPLISDDDNDRWRVYLGRIIRLPDGTIMIDSAQRSYVGLVGEVIDHPANGARLEIGKQSSNNDKRNIGEVTYEYEKGEDAQRKQSRRFAIFVPEADVSGSAEQQVKISPRFDILQSGVMRIRGRTIINGNLQITDGAVQFNEPASFSPENAPQKPSIYRITSTAGGGDQLRIDLGSENTIDREFVIGFSNEEGEFVTCLKLELKDNDPNKLTPLVTINGDLMLNGEVVGGNLVPRALSQEAFNAILASFQAGVAASNNV